MATKPTDLGVYCRQEDIFEESLTGDNVLSKLSKPISKGIACELNVFRKKHGFSWDVLYDWLKQLSQEPLPPLATIRTSISRIEKKRSELSRNKQRVRIQEMLQAPLFSAISRKNPPDSLSSFSLNEPASQEKTVTVDIARELVITEELEAERRKTDHLSAQLSKLSVRNFNKTLKRRDDELKCYKSDLSSLKDENKSKSSQINSLHKQIQSSKLASERHRVAGYRANTGADLKLADLEERLMSKIEGLESNIEDLAQSLDTARTECDTRWFSRQSN